MGERQRRGLGASTLRERAARDHREQAVVPIRPAFVWHGRGPILVTSARLTPRERQIVRAIAGGGTNRDIGRRLGVREQTIKNQLSVIYGKLGVRNRLELAIYAARHGLLDAEAKR